METPLTAIELSGTVDERSQLQLDGPLPIPGPRRVRVIVLYGPEEDASEAEWLQAAAHNPAFDDLAGPEEDVYTREDGKPLS